MEHISIKDHPPWYARGTPVINTRDGPAMALNNKLLFAICRGPSARGEPGGKTRRWLTLKKSILVDADFVVDADRSGDAVRSVGNFDLSACGAFRFIGTSSDNVKMKKKANVGMEMVEEMVDADRSGDAVRSGEDADLSACAAPDNVKFLDDNNNVDGLYFKQTN